MMRVVFFVRNPSTALFQQVDYTAEVLLQHVRIGVESHLRARVPGKLLHRLHRGASTKQIASGKATDSNASVKTAHERHIRNTILGYLFRVFRAALNASM